MWRPVSDRPVVYNILSFSVVDVTSELLVIENENTISWQKIRYKLLPPPPSSDKNKFGVEIT
jgi:hypothetical protein